MSSVTTSISIISYPGCMQSAVQGLKEMFLLSNTICEKQNVPRTFDVQLLNIDQLAENNKATSIIIIPPDVQYKYYQKPDSNLLEWISQQHEQGSVICSICLGAFILAKTGLLQNRKATTHWELTQEFSEQYPNVLLNTNDILINDGDIITAGGVMAWVDLGLEIISQFTNANVMRRLGKILVIDTGKREQRYYQVFSPKFDHGYQEILKAQHFMQANYQKPISVNQLADLCFLTERTFLRHFVKATGFKPIQYLQKLRVQIACNFLETSNLTIDNIAYKVGYEDTSAFRKVFIKLTGLTPKAFKNRFFN